MTEERILGRKNFFQIGLRFILGLAGLLGLGGLVRFFSHKPPPGQPDIFDLGIAADFPIEGRMVRADIPAVIYQTEDGFHAYSLICTHLGCNVDIDGENFNCPCHGSRFDQEGRVLKGPADKKLSALQIKVSQEGNLILYTQGADQ